MENIALVYNTKDEDRMNLPPGFRFHPTDEELITHYLFNKVTLTNFSAIAIGEVDLNSSEPWDLPQKAKLGEEEWYFFCVRDRKYPTGLRTNRATKAGYWKATGKDREIYRGKSLVGMKKTLVFYRGRAPKGEKANWVMHEYRLDGKFSVHNLPKTAKNEWVICRVFRKNSGGNKTHMSAIMRFESTGNGLGGSSVLQPLADSSPVSAYVSCFSIAIHDQRNHGGTFDSLGNSNSLWGIPLSSPPEILPRIPLSGSFQAPANLPISSGLAFSWQDHQNLLKAFLENHGSISKEEQILSVSQENDMNPEIYSGISSFDDSAAAPVVEPDSLWNY